MSANSSIRRKGRTNSLARFSPYPFQPVRRVSIARTEILDVTQQFSPPEELAITEPKGPLSLTGCESTRSESKKQRCADEKSNTQHHCSRRNSGCR